MLARCNHWFWSVCRIVFRLRYRIELTGAEELKNLRGPVLVLPNHPAYVDPALLTSQLRLHRPLRPLVFSASFRAPLLRRLFAIMRAIEVPDLSQHSPAARQQGIELIDEIARRIDNGECLLIYPSGRIQRGNQEIVGATRSAFELISRRPEVNVVLVRTRGVWGSSFSCAATGALPHLPRTLVRNMLWAAASLFVFLPKRNVTLEVQLVRPGQLPLDNRLAFNAYLEQWYNADGGEEPQFVRYHHWFGPRQGNFRVATQHTPLDIIDISPATREAVNELLEAQLKRPLEASICNGVTDGLTTLESLGLDSLDRMDVSLALERQFGHSSPNVAERIGELWAIAEGKGSQTQSAKTTLPETWFQFPAQQTAPKVEGQTLGEAFLRRALANLNQPIVNDQVSGMLTHRRMLIAARLLAKQFALLPEKHIGILLPASVAADIVFFALQLANKIPVMLNWTTGSHNISHALLQTSVQHVVTARRLMDRLDLELPGTELVFMEDLKLKIRRFDAVGELLRTYSFPGSIVQKFNAPSPDETAVFLFTSGSESAPKTVPLTHRNLLVNLRAGLLAFDAHTHDSLLGFLPPFHSFGLLANVLLVHLAGIRCTRFADPTDVQALRGIIRDCQPSLLFTTPTLFERILSVSGPQDMSSLRRVVTGAEKCPERLFELCQRVAPETTILEGYGITECSPVISINRVAATKRGTAGQPIEQVVVKVIDVDTQAVLECNQTGMLVVSGPSIFAGYYQHAGSSPFIQLDGRSWYKTGDLVYLDEEGFIHFRGRLKRFLKAGGEMISLPALEEPFSKLFPGSEQGPRVAVEGIEGDVSRRIVLFTCFELTHHDANRILLDAGFRGVMRIDEVRQLDSIPLLGTGKVDYRQLREMINSAGLLV